MTKQNVSLFVYTGIPFGIRIVGWPWSKLIMNIHGVDMQGRSSAVGP